MTNLIEVASQAEQEPCQSWLQKWHLHGVLLHSWEDRSAPKWTLAFYKPLMMELHLSVETFSIDSSYWAGFLYSQLERGFIFSSLLIITFYFWFPPFLWWKDSGDFLGRHSRFSDFNHSICASALFEPCLWHPCHKLF